MLIVIKPFKTSPALISAKKSPGYCFLCGTPATTEAFFHVDGVTIIQRYCDNCLPKANY